MYRGEATRAVFVYTAHGEMPSLVRKWLFRWKRRVKRQLLNWKWPLVSYYNPLHSLGVYVYTWQVEHAFHCQYYIVYLINYACIIPVWLTCVLSILGLSTCMVMFTFPIACYTFQCIGQDLRLYFLIQSQYTLWCTHIRAGSTCLHFLLLTLSEY